MMGHVDELSEEAIPLDDMSHNAFPSPSIPRKPLPPDSPYSPPNSPRTSMILPQSPILANTIPPNPPLITSPRQINVPLSPETAFIKDDSFKSVSLTSTPDHSNHDSAPQPLTKSPVDTSYSRYTYRALHPIPEGEEIGYERMSLSGDDFPMRPKSFGTFKTQGGWGRKKGWMIVVLVMLIILIIVAVLAVLGLSRSMGMQEGMQE